MMKKKRSSLLLSPKSIIGARDRWQKIHVSVWGETILANLDKLGRTAKDIDF
jgi:hypothetical protein